MIQLSTAGANPHIVLAIRSLILSCIYSCQLCSVSSRSFIANKDILLIKSRTQDNRETKYVTPITYSIHTAYSTYSSYSITNNSFLTINYLQLLWIGWLNYSMHRRS